MCEYKGLSVIFFSFFLFIFACFRRVLGLLFVIFSLFCFLFSMFKDQALSLCTNIFSFGNIMIW